MSVLRISLAFLVLSVLLVGCETPLVRVNVNGEGISQPQVGGGGCGYPCFCPTCGGGADWASEEGHQAKVLLVEEGQTVYTFVDTEGKTIRVINPELPGGKKFKPGTKVQIKKNGTEWSLVNSIHEKTAKR